MPIPQSLANVRSIALQMLVLLLNTSQGCTQPPTDLEPYFCLLHRTVFEKEGFRQPEMVSQWMTAAKALT